MAFPHITIIGGRAVCFWQLVLALSLMAMMPEKLRAQPVNRIDQRELIVITSQPLVKAWTVYVEWKRGLGVPCGIVTLEQIDATTQGVDGPARIRAFITGARRTTGTQWFLLGGDSDTLPPRMVKCEAYNAAERAYLNGPVATDLYYADLDGTWDGNGNQEFGELDDECDLMPDVYVGRVPARTEAEVLNWLMKLRAYESAPQPDYQDRLLLLGERVATMLGMPICSSLALEATVVRSLPKHTEVVRLYDDVCARLNSQPRTAASQAQAIQSGVNLVLNFGHGMWDWLGAMSLPEISRLTNSARPGVYMTTECNGCEFALASVDHVACESFLLSQGGGVAYLGNTEFGVGVPWLTSFYDSLFKALFQKPQTTLGQLVADSQVAYSNPELLARPMLDQRWQQFVLVLMGDPSMRVWTARPQPMTLERTLSSSGTSDVHYYRVTSDGRGLAGVQVTLHASEKYLYTAVTGADGTAEFRWDGKAPTDFVQVSASAANRIPVFATY